MCCDFLQKFCLQLFPTQEKFTEVVTEIYVGLRVKYLLFLCDINHTYICITQYKISWKSIQHKLGCSMWTDSAPPPTQLQVSKMHFCYLVAEVALISVMLLQRTWTLW